MYFLMRYVKKPFPDTFSAGSGLLITDGKRAAIWGTNEIIN